MADEVLGLFVLIVILSMTFGLAFILCGCIKDLENAIKNFHYDIDKDSDQKSV